MQRALDYSHSKQEYKTQLESAVQVRHAGQGLCLLVCVCVCVCMLGEDFVCWSLLGNCKCLYLHSMSRDCLRCAVRKWAPACHKM